MASSPLIELQRRSGATIGETYGSPTAITYSTVEEEYAAATGAVALVDRSYVGRLRVAGSDSLELLNRLSTNQLSDLAPGEGAGTVLTSGKGRIVDLLFLHAQSDHLLAFTAPQNRQKVAEWIDFYTFGEDVSVEDLTEETAMLALAGPRSSDLISLATERDLSSMPLHGSMTANVCGSEVVVVRSDFAGLPAYDLIVSSERGEALWKELMERGADLGIRPAGRMALELVRIEQGVPAYGPELNEGVNPLEAGLTEFISFNKGCYVGQEVVARLDTYRKVQRHLVGIRWSQDHAPADDARLLSEGKLVGRLTSAVNSFKLGAWVGLSYVRRELAEPATQLTLDSVGGEVPAEVSARPFSP